jgi:splicing factor 3B subunit 3
MTAAPVIATTSKETKEGDHEDVSVQSFAMKLLDVRFQPATAILSSLSGEFTGAGEQEIACLKAGGTLEVYRINSAQGGSLKLVARVETRCVLRCASTVRFPGEKRDALAVASDSGALSVLDFSGGVCKSVHDNVVFGKSACRRETPGQYIASDPKGRALMIAAIEKRKLVYVLNRDATGKPTIASPLEAHRSRTLTFACVGVDNGYDNPIFACLELQYADTDSASASPSEKQLAYYELDLGLNHVSRRWATVTQASACCLAAVPGGADGPSGVLVGSEDCIEYLNESTRVVCAIPRRKLHTKGILITTITLHKQKKGKFFALIQSEIGDTYKVTFQFDDDKKVIGITIQLLDTLPVANALNVSKLGTLFCASQFGDHKLYQFENIDIPDAPTMTSVETKKALGEARHVTTEAVSKVSPTFEPSILKNLRTIFTLENPSPTTGVMVGELAGNEVSPQIYTLTGRGPCSAIRISRHGASVTELAVSDLPGVPGGIFTIADNTAEAAGKSRNDKYIVVSFADATLVLSVGETVEEVGKESGFLTNAPTLACSALGNDGSVCQVHPSGVRQIQKGQAKQWHCPGLKRIECASVNESQVIIALAGGEVIYFELDPVSGNLIESATRDMGADVCCLDVGSIPKGRSRSLFAAVGCRDQTVRLVSLEPGNLLSQKSSTALKSRPHSVALQNMFAPSIDGAKSSGDDLTLVVGLDEGSALRAAVDPVTGSIGNSPTRRFLGARPVAVSRISLESQSAVLLLSSRPWISRRDAGSGKHVMAPLSYVPLDHGCSFTSDSVTEGVVATAGKTLRILSIDSAVMDGGDSEAFNTQKASLRYTPRQMTLMSVPIGENNQQRKVVLAVVESDTNDYGLEEKKALGFDPSGEGGGSKKIDGDAMDMDVDSDDEGNKDNDQGVDEDDDADEKEARQTIIRGPIPPEPGHWGSCIRLLDPANSCDTLDCIEMGRNEAALCCASVRFHSKGGEPLLAVGTVTGLTVHPLKQSASHILLYRVISGYRLQLLHRTPVEDGPVLALSHYQGRLLVGVGQSLRLYEMGKRQLLRKCELRGLPTFVKTIQTVGDRAFIGDMMQSIQVVQYDAGLNRLKLIAKDACPRPIVCQELLDWNTVAVGDKFGNVSVLRLPRGVDPGAVDTTGNRALWDSARDDLTPKLELLCHYYIGEVVTSMTRSSLVAGGAESLIYVTVTGRIGALVPFTSRDDVEFFSQLERLLQAEVKRPTGRDPRSYRSYYTPVMHVIDGDLCEAYTALAHEEQSKIAEKLDRTIGEVMKKLEDTRNGLL